MDLRERLAHALRREREGVGISVSELARRAGVSKATVSQLESGAGNPSVETLWAIGDALGVPFSTLVDDRTQAARLIRLGDSLRLLSSLMPRVSSLDARPHPPNGYRLGRPRCECRTTKPACRATAPPKP